MQTHQRGLVAQVQHLLDRWLTRTPLLFTVTLSAGLSQFVGHFTYLEWLASTVLWDVSGAPIPRPYYIRVKPNSGVAQ